MSGLLYKECVVIRSWLILVTVLQFFIHGINIFCASVNGASEENMSIQVMLYVVAFIVGGLINSEIFRNDESGLWRTFVTSTPQSYIGQVKCKYYFILIINIVVLTLCVVTDIIVLAIHKTEGVPLLTLCAMFFCFMLIANAIEIPFIIRFGADSGINIKASMIVVVALIAGIYVLFGELSIFLSEKLMEALIEFFTEGNAMWIPAMVPPLSVLIYYMSYRISLLLYRKGVENYE